MEKIFSTQFGSRLYGTQTPTSDLDIKHVVLPDLGDLLLGKKVQNTVKKTNTDKNTRNGVDDIDEEFIPIQVFARDFVMGQTYALEIAFAVEGTHARQIIHDRGQFTQSKFLMFVRELRTQFLTSNIKAMMGYVVNQASLYSFKGERLNVSREFRECLLKGFTDPECGTDPLTDFVTDLENVQRFEALQAKYPKYFKITEYDIGGSRMRPCFMLLEKCFPYTNTLEHSLQVVNTLIKKYGARADQASESNVDWKATMHALRIVDEGLQLLRHKKMTFPFEENYVEHLLAVKRGELPLDPIKDELSAKLEELKTLELTTDLPSSDAEFMNTFEEWLKVWMYNFYNLN